MEINKRLLPKVLEEFAGNNCYPQTALAGGTEPYH